MDTLIGPAILVIAGLVSLVYLWWRLAHMIYDLGPPLHKPIDKPPPPRYTGIKEGHND